MIGLCGRVDFWEFGTTVDVGLRGSFRGNCGGMRSGDYLSGLYVSRDRRLPHDALVLGGENLCVVWVCSSASASASACACAWTVRERV